jgi:hypothetical protein
MIVLIDGDSIAYAMAYGADEESLLHSSIDKKMAEILHECGSTDYKLFLEHWEGKHIFRDDIAVTKPYKGNRAGEKPALLQAAKEYLHKTWNAVLCTKEESEDQVAILATKHEGNCIIAAIDKDLLQVPGRHYNYNTGVCCVVSKYEGHYNLFHQILTGDATDNIPGCPGIGKVKASKFLGVGGDLPRSVARLYKEAGCSYDFLVEQSRLIYLRRQEGELFEFPITRGQYARL